MFDLKANSGLAKIRKGNAFIQKGNYKILHLVNLQNVRVTLNQIDNIALQLGTDNDFRNILVNKISNLNKAFQNLVPKSRVRRSWESLGAGIKWMAGNADADDLRDINNKFEKMQMNQDMLASSNNEQIEINNVFEDRLNAISKLISTSISSKLNSTFTSLEIINLMFNIDLAKEKLESINEAVVLAKVKVVSKNILEENELKLIFDKLKTQNFSLSSMTEMFAYLEAAVEYKDEIIHYHVNIPQVEGGFDKLHVEPLIIDNKQIKIDHNEILIKDNKTFAVAAQCLETLTNTLCKPSQLQDISSDQCVPRLVRDAAGDCIFKEVSDETDVKAIGDGTILIRNAITPVRLTNTCGMASHTIVGTFLIFFRNCSITLNDDTYENIEMQHKEQFEILPFFNVTIRQRNIEPLVDMHELHDLHIKHRKKLEMFHEQRTKDNWISFSVIASITVIMLFVIIATIIFLKRGGKHTLPILQHPRDENGLAREESSNDELAQRAHTIKHPFLR